jgi:hypothetical protein
LKSRNANRTASHFSLIKEQHRIFQPQNILPAAQSNPYPADENKTHFWAAPRMMSCGINYEG